MKYDAWVVELPYDEVDKMKIQSRVNSTEMSNLVFGLVIGFFAGMIAFFPGV